MVVSAVSLVSRTPLDTQWTLAGWLEGGVSPPAPDPASCCLSVKPDPPEGVRLSVLPRQRLWVQWEPPRSWPFPELFSLKYWIRYKHHGSPRFRQVRGTKGG